MLSWIFIFIFGSMLIGTVAAMRNRASDRKVEQARIDAKLAEVERRKAAEASGEGATFQRRRVRRR